jgi:DNA replication and repair protein RecF
MHVKKLRLQNFRNYPELDVDLAQELTFFFGNNAQGKTNILEALYFLSTTQSPRTQKDQELVRWGEDEALIEAQVETRTGRKIVMLQIKKNGEKMISIDHKYLRKSSDLLGQFPMIFFSPEDLEVIKKAPQGRRRFLDILFAQTSRQYAYDLLQYDKVLRQRNECLRQIYERRTTPAALQPWNEELLAAGARVTKSRKQELPLLIAAAEAIHAELTDGKERLTLRYISSWEEDLTLARERLRQNEDHEIASQRTLFGPHRDDIVILVNEREAKVFASHGQQRTAMISLKMAEIKYMEQAFGERPIVLLDDILLELDPQRFSALLKTLFQRTQTIMTGTEVHRFVTGIGAQSRIFEVNNGKVLAKD